MSTTQIRILLADDQSLVRGALAALLNLELDLTVVAEVSRGDEVVEAARTSQPDVALLDVEMPGMDGVSAARALLEAMPRCKVVMVTTFGRPGYLRKAMAARAWFHREGHPGMATCGRRTTSPQRPSGRRPKPRRRLPRQGDSPLTERDSDVTARGNGRWHGCGHRPRTCHSQKAPCATTCPALSAKPVPARVPRPPG